MGSPNLVPIPSPDDKLGVVRALQKLASLRLNSDSTPTFAELTLTGELISAGIGTGYVDYDITATPGDGAEGRSKWNPDEHTLDLTTGLGPVLQVGQESFVLVYNGTGSTIYNGTAIYPVGATAGRPSVAEAAANTFVTFRGVVLVTTMDIPTGTVGIVSQDGKVRGVDTSGFTEGDTLWLSEDGDGVLNNLTNVRPSFPSYAIQIGGVAVEDADGTIQLEISGKAVDTTQNFWNGTFRESFDFFITEDGGTVTGTLTPTNGHPDMTMMFSDGFTMLDTDPGATIDLTSEVGTDTAPTTVYVYIPKSTKVLTLADESTGWPRDVEHIRVAQLVLQSAVTTGTSGALRNQNWNDEIQDTTTNQGHASHIGARIRGIEAEWELGAEGTLTVADTANSYVSITSGRVFQMHNQVYPALSMPTDNMEVVNDPDTAYNPIITLNDIVKTSDGTPIPNNRWLSVVIWGVCNKSGETSHMLCNVPAGTYTSEALAQTDSLGYSNFTIPKIFKGVGFLIARFTIQRKTSTINYLGGSSYQDLRGFIPNSTAGSGAGGSGVTTFTALTDTPASYVGEQFKILQVNTGETGLELIAQSAIDHNTLTNTHNLTTDIDHGSITGLTDDDHVGYLLIDGTRAMTGDLDMGANNIGQVGDIVPDEDNLYSLGAVELIPGGGFELQEESTSESTEYAITANQWGMQTFTPDEDYLIGRVILKLRENQAGEILLTVGIYATSGGKPTGSVLVEKVVDLDGLGNVLTEATIDFDTPYALLNGVQYAIVMHTPAGGIWGAYGTPSTSPGGSWGVSFNQGSSWTTNAGWDWYFQVYASVASEETIRWSDLYLAGDLKDGTNEISIAELQAAYDHIHNLTTDIDHDTLTGFVGDEHEPHTTWAGSANLTTLGTIATGVWEATDVGIAHGGTGQSTQQAAIDALTDVSGATNEYVLTKDTSTGNAIWKVGTGGGFSPEDAIDHVDHALSELILEATMSGSETTLHAIVTMNGKLYGGTQSGGELLEWSPGDTEWTSVASLLDSQTVIKSLCVLGGKVYGGTQPTGQLFEWNGTNAWVSVAPQLNSQTKIRSLTVANGKIYGGTGDGGRLFEWNGTNAWVEVAPQFAAEASIPSLVTFNDEVYAGSQILGNLLKWNGTNAWTSVASFHDSSTNIRCLAVYNGKIYGGDQGVGKLLEWDGSSAWATVANQFEDETNILVLFVYQGELYGSTQPGSMLLKWNGVDSWIKVADQAGGDQDGLFGGCVMGDRIYCGSHDDGELYSWGNKNTTTINSILEALESVGIIAT
jgi:hypothetical protein